MLKFPFYKQLNEKDCGPTCLKMIAKFYGRTVSLQTLRELSETTREGTSLNGLSAAAEQLGFRTLPGKLDFQQLQQQAPLPCLVHWNQVHFVVVYRIKRNTVYVADPAYGLLKYSKQEFLSQWIGPQTSDHSLGIVLLFEPTEELNNQEDDRVCQKRDFSFVLQYLFKYKKFLWQLLLGIVAESAIQLIIPFLTASIVDTGIQNQDILFIYLMLGSQLFLFAGKTGIEILRGWIVLHISARLNISLLSDFFLKLMQLPIAYFDLKVSGDIMQRIKDHQKIESFLTSTSLSTLFSLFNLIIFSFILAWYSLPIFVLFTGGSLLYIGWILLFLKRREALDYKMFSQLSLEQDKVMELIGGMQDIKLSNSERRKRWSWERLQARLFSIQLKGLALDQTQSIGANVINELKNLFITFLAVSLVISGDMTLGMMLAISYIIGQLNYPLLELVRFVHAAQDAGIAYKRLAEIHQIPVEVPQPLSVSHIIPAGDIVLKNVSFRYTGALRPVIEGVNLVIPRNKVTAIVGASGSGKTTLLKMLLQFYSPSEGEIWVGPQLLGNISPQAWRNTCGVVMQDGYIFNDTIAHNIALGEEELNKEQLLLAVEAANIKSFIESLPLGYNTRLGTGGGVNISAGEKQRILIARAIYKNPAIVFLDEATSALDATNEKTIMENIGHFFVNRTAVVIAHRLSTVREANQIVVMERGRIVEVGNHDSLVEKSGTYYALVKNQLALD
jgi:ATP-binding cassette, subfamily B, bacterial